MVEEEKLAINPKDMSDRLYEKYSNFIYSECGIKLPPVKRVMLQSRLLKRLRSLGIHSYEEYYDYLTSAKGRDEELVHALDMVSTNKTDFFREPSHFDYLCQVALPEILRSAGGRPRKRIHLWSAGCSSGEEPYTLAMVLSNFLEKYPEIDYDILSTDISQRMLDKARQAIYTDIDVRPIPHDLKVKYFMKGKGTQEGNWRVIPELRKRVQFSRLNLMDNRFDLPNPMDIIFCRNVIIYFDRPTQVCLFQKLYDCMVCGGFLFIGHSETLYGINDRFHYIQATIYQKPK
ncbi:MAG: protein-glutamate O-methyltransferase [bacterium]